jgi:hypothetical protein
MPLRNAEPKRWVPKGLSDAVDGSTAFPGAMTALSNLVADPSTEGVFVPRPAAVQLSPLGNIPNPGLVSCAFIQSDILYGLIGSSLNAGCDQPFAFNLATQQPIKVYGITAQNVPTTQPTAGDWTPANMDAVDSKIIVSHPGFNTYNGYFGWFDVTVPTRPIWNSGNTSIYPLPSVPVSVCQFGGRIYYACGNSVVASDVQLPLQVSNTAVPGVLQVLTFGDRTSVTAMAGLPLQNQLGGIIQSLIVFKSANIMYQVTGDYALQTWAVNSMNVATGTKAPNTICSTNEGLVFVAPDGVRMIDFMGRVSDPIGANGNGVTVPFFNAVAPTRMVAAYNNNMLRISVQNGLAPTPGPVEYWYDYTLKIWTGPHSFPVAYILPWRNTFIVFNSLIPGV